MIPRYKSEFFILILEFELFLLFFTENDYLITKFIKIAIKICFDEDGYELG